MNLVTRVWNYQSAATLRRSIKSKAIGGIVWFLALMACFTIVSRASSSITVSVVQTEKPVRSTLSHIVTVDGVFETSRDTGIATAQDALAQEQVRSAGERVRTARNALRKYDGKRESPFGS